MDAIYLICYGDSEENLKISLNTKIIGASNNKKIPLGQLIYLIVKREGKWTVVGKGHLDEEVDKNHFEKPNRFKTYSVKYLKACNPFSISEICKSELGSSYGLVLRSPQPITAEKFVSFLEKNS